MKYFKLGKNKQYKKLEILVVPKLQPPNRIPLKLFRNVHPPKIKKQFYFESN